METETEAEAEPKPITADLFIIEAIVNIAFLLSCDDWNLLRNETNIGRLNRSFGPMPPCFEYAEFYAPVSINNAQRKVKLTNPR